MSTLAGRYVIERRLGGGGMAEVFLARLVGKEGFSRAVAIKRVLPHLAENAAFVGMFVAEARICSRLQHPNIVSVIDFDRDEQGRPFLVIELVDGPSLAELADSGRLPHAAAIHVAMELLRGLAYAHDSAGPDDAAARGIVHRDISPHNVLLSWEGAIKLSDFGIAKARAATGATASELVKGKPAYMSPEQANAEPLDGRSDLFAVGIVLWELLVGRALFSGHTTQETLARVLFAPIPSPRSLAGDVPADVDAVVMKLLAREVADRYADASAVIADLVACSAAPRNGRELLVALLAERFPADAPVRGRGVADVPTVQTPLELAATLPSPRDAQPPAQRSRSWLLALGALAVAAVAVAVTAIALRPPASSTSRGAAVADAVVVADAPVVVDAPIAVVDAATPPSDAAPRRRATRVTSTPEQRAAERARIREAMTGSGTAPFMEPPTSFDVAKLVQLARARAESALGPVTMTAMRVSRIDGDGRLAFPGAAVSLTFRATQPEADATCIRFESTGTTGRIHLMLIANPAGCGNPLQKETVVCSGREFLALATAAGAPDGPVTVELQASRWWIIVDTFMAYAALACR